MEAFLRKQRVSITKKPPKRKKKKNLKSTLKLPDINAKGAPTGHPNDDLRGDLHYDEFDAYDDNDEEEDVCTKCMKLLRDHELKQIVKDQNAPVQVVSVLHKLQEAVRRRKKADTEDKINVIMGRVTEALQHSGMDSDDIDGVDEKSFDLEGQKAKKFERRIVQGIIKNSEKTIKNRKEIITELKGWLDVLKRDWQTVCSMKLSSNMPEDEYQEILETFARSGEAVKKIDFLFQNGLKSAMTQKPLTPLRKMPNFIPFNESDDEFTLSECESASSTTTNQKGEVSSAIAKDIGNVSGPDQLRSVFRRISNAIQLALDPISDPRPHFRTIKKQFKLISNEFQKQDEKINDLENENLKISTESTNDIKYYQQQKETDTETIRRLTDETVSLQEKISELEEKLAQPINLVSHPVHAYDEFQRERRTPVVIDEPESDDSPFRNASNKRGNGKRRSQRKKGSTVGGARWVNRRHTLPYRKNLTECDSLSDFDNEDDDNAFLEEEEEEDGKRNAHSALVEELKRRIADLENESSIANIKIASQEKNIEELNEKNQLYEDEIKMLTENKEANENTIRELETSIEELTKQVEEEKNKREEAEKKAQEQMDMFFDDNKEGNVTSESSTQLNGVSRNQALARMQKQWKREVQTLRNYVEKEKQRHKAQLRQGFLDHKKVENHIRDDNMHLMRALYRFKRVINRLMYHADARASDDALEEGEAQLLKSYQDEGDTMILSQSADEILLSLEQNLAKILLTKNLEMKDTKTEKWSAVRDLKEYRTRLSNTKDICEKQEKFVKMTAGQNTVLTNAYQKLLMENEWLVKKLSHQPEVTTVYENEAVMTSPEDSNDAKESSGGHVDSIDSSSPRETQDQCVVDKKIETLLKEDSETNSRSTSVKKMKLIKSALENNQMTLVDFEQAKDIVIQGSKISRDMLVSLVQKYVASKRMLTVKNTLTSLGDKHKSNKRVQKHIEYAEKRHEESLKRFELRKTELRKEREDAILKLGNIMEKQILGGLTVKPYANNNHLSRMAAKLASKGTIETKKDKDGIEEVIGTSLKQDEMITSYWKMTPHVSSRLVRLTVPKLLDMDVNQWKKCLEEQKSKGDRKEYVPAIASLFP